jgi:hypothetical protein
MIAIPVPPKPAVAVIGTTVTGIAGRADRDRLDRPRTMCNLALGLWVPS